MSRLPPRSLYPGIEQLRPRPVHEQGRGWNSLVARQKPGSGRQTQAGEHRNPEAVVLASHERNLEAKTEILEPFRRLVRRPLAFLTDSATRYAILTGLTIAIYALIDKRGVSHVQPFLYMYLMTLGSAAALAPYVLRKQGWTAVRREGRVSLLPITGAGLLTFLAYGLVLTAFSLSRVSYVAPAREIGIVIGVLMGVFILKEPFGGGRLLGSGFIVLGLGLIAFSP